jgi:hypothetical protein
MLTGVGCCLEFCGAWPGEAKACAPHLDENAAVSILAAG